MFYKQQYSMIYSSIKLYLSILFLISISKTFIK